MDVKLIGFLGVSILWPIVVDFQAIGWFPRVSAIYLLGSIGFGPVAFIIGVFEIGLGLNQFDGTASGEPAAQRAFPLLLWVFELLVGENSFAKQPVFPDAGDFDDVAFSQTDSGLICAGWWQTHFQALRNRQIPSRSWAYAFKGLRARPLFCLLSQLLALKLFIFYFIATD